jgi:hypothetical protein
MVILILLKLALYLKKKLLMDGSKYYLKLILQQKHINLKFIYHNYPRIYGGKLNGIQI